MAGRFVGAALVVLATLVIVKPSAAEITPEQIRRCIERAQGFLIRDQKKDRGNWDEYTNEPGGLTSLCTLALLNSGVDTKSPVIQKALNYLRGIEPKHTYSTSLQTMVFCAAEPRKDMLLIQRNARWLERTQLTDLNHPRRGSWSYSGGDRTKGDNSNSQFALLGLHEASQVGVQISERTWRLAYRYWQQCQDPDDGGYGYIKGFPSTGSMTCAGISSLIITMDKLPEHRRDASVVSGRVSCCGERTDTGPLNRALQWLGSDVFSIETNPTAAGSAGGRYYLYYLYGLERVGRLSGQRFFGRHDWYREGAEVLVENQDLTGSWVGVGHAENNELIATALALLFLSKGRRPVVMAKYKHSDDEQWDLHRRAVHNLATSVEQRWKQPLTWQAIEGRVATVNDLMETPVLFISGRRPLRLSGEQKDNLREYIDQGGFIFAEACVGPDCDGAGFHDSFVALMGELFPDSSFRRLEPYHPVYFAERRVVPSVEDRYLYGLEACCRTSVVYCPSTLSCYWELHRLAGKSDYPEQVEKEIDECLAIGQNVLAYATNREVKAKLERPQALIGGNSTSGRSRGRMTVAKLSHTGGSDDAPSALRNLLTLARHELDMQDGISEQSPLISPDHPDLYQHPIVFIHGRRSFRFSASQRKALATYLQRGGFIFGDAICASQPFADSFRRELKAMFPEGSLQRLAADHPVFRDEFRGYDVTTVTLRAPQTGAADDPLRAKLIKTEPYLEALELDGRIAVIFSPYDISCAMENHASLECKGYIRADAARIGFNVLLYALQQ